MPLGLAYANTKLQEDVADATALELRLYEASPGPNGTDSTAVAVIDATGRFADASGGGIANDLELLSAPFAATEVVAHVGLWDVSATPVLIAYGPSNATRTIQEGDSWRAQVGALTLTHTTL